MRRLRLWAFALATVLIAIAAQAAPLTRAQALKALEQPDSAARLAAIERLAEIGRMDDVDRVLARLEDPDPQVRTLAAAATWQIWSRSGDPAIDKLFARGIEQMEAAALEDALATFSIIVKRKPAFAEGWNKRATIHFLLGHYARIAEGLRRGVQAQPEAFRRAVRRRPDPSPARPSGARARLLPPRRWRSIRTSKGRQR